MESGNQPANTESNLNPETTNRLVDNIIHELKNWCFTICAKKIALNKTEIKLNIKIMIIFLEFVYII